MHNPPSGLDCNQRRSPRTAAPPGTVVILRLHTVLEPDEPPVPPIEVKGILTDRSPQGVGVLCVSSIEYWAIGQCCWLIQEDQPPPILAQIIWIRVIDNCALRLGLQFFDRCDREHQVAATHPKNSKNPAIPAPWPEGAVISQSLANPSLTSQPLTSQPLTNPLFASPRPATQAAPSAQGQSLQSTPQYRSTQFPATPPVPSPSATLQACLTSPVFLENLYQSSLLHGVDPKLFNDILPHCILRSFRAGELLIQPGQRNQHLHLLLSGYLRVSLSNLPTDYSNPNLNITVSPGECIGEMSVIENRPVSAYVMAETEGQLLQIPAQLFWEHLIHIPRLTQNLLRDLSSRIRRSDAIILHDLEQRLRLEQLEKDLQFASEIQFHILPRFPALPHHPLVEVSGQVQPAKEVGGDFFDVFELDHRHVCIAVGDVSGKGIPAALFMIRSITLLRLIISPVKSLDTAMAQINNHLCQNNENNMFLTLFVGILDTETGQFTYGNGGHIPPLIRSQDQPWQSLPLPQGILLGLRENLAYNLASLTLQPGDTLVAYTDGVTEAENNQQALFGVDRAKAALQQVPASASAETLVRTLKAAVTQFAEETPPSDDLTLLALRFAPAIGSSPWGDGEGPMGNGS
ncbi:MAG: SpoIIE family protein phosphatase [Prochlorothrix sp.]